MNISARLSANDVAYRQPRPDDIERASALLASTSTGDLGHRIHDLLISRVPGRVHRAIIAEANGRMLGAAIAGEEPTFPGEVYTTVAVDQEARGRGIGSRLASQVLAAVDEHHEQLNAMLLLRDDDPRGRAFAERYGFVVAAHSIGWQHDLTDVEAAAIVLRAAAARGITVRVADRPTEAATITGAVAQAMQGMPGPFGNEPQVDVTKLLDYFPEESVIILAETATAVVGVGVVHPTADPHVWYTDFTGVSRQHRGQGISHLLKAAELLEAAGGGGRMMRTHNDVTNAGMIAVNKSTGMTPAAGQWWLSRVAARATRDTEQDLGS